MSNSLRGGKNIYGPRALCGNWYEERLEPQNVTAGEEKAMTLPPGTAKTWTKTSEELGSSFKDLTKGPMRTDTDNWMNYQKPDGDQYRTTHMDSHGNPRDQAVVEKFRRAVVGRAGAHGVNKLGRLFKKMDTNADREVTLAELERGMREFGPIGLTMQELQALLVVLDKSQSGTINLKEFMASVRGFVSTRREQMIMMAFQVFDKTGDGIVNLEDLKASYNCDYDPDVLSGRQSPSAALAGFLEQFDTIDKDGVVTKDEFLEYYRNLSASITSDDYFELMIRNAWHIPGGEGWCENTANLRVMVAFKDGRQEVHMIQDDLGIDRDDKKAIRKELVKQGLEDAAIAEISVSM